MAVAMPAAVSAGEAKDKGASHENQDRVAPNYVRLPKMQLGVIVDDNRTYSMLELEAWLVLEKPEDAAKISQMKSKIRATMKERFLRYKWEAFKDAETGKELAKDVVKMAVNDATHQPVQDVEIRSMVLR